MRLKEEEASTDRKQLGGFTQGCDFSNESNISKDYDMWKQRKDHMNSVRK